MINILLVTLALSGPWVEIDDRTQVMTAGQGVIVFRVVYTPRGGVSSSMIFIPNTYWKINTKGRVVIKSRPPWAKAKISEVTDGTF